MSKLRLIQFSGLQATGKTLIATHIANELSIPYFSKDEIESRLQRDQLTDGHSIHSYHLMLDLASLQLSLGVSVVLDAVFPLAGFRESVRRIADHYRAAHYVIHTYCSDELVHRRRIEARDNRTTSTPVGWHDVQATRAIYQAWNPNEALFLDAFNPLSLNLDRLRDYLSV